MAFSRRNIEELRRIKFLIIKFSLTNSKHGKVFQLKYVKYNKTNQI